MIESSDDRLLTFTEEIPEPVAVQNSLFVEPVPPAAAVAADVNAVAVTGNLLVNSYTYNTLDCRH